MHHFRTNVQYFTSISLCHLSCQ